MIREALQKDISVMEKSSPVDLVTETDQRVEQFIISSIKEKFPTHRWIFILFQVWLYLTLVLYSVSYCCDIDPSVWFLCCFAASSVRSL